MSLKKQLFDLIYMSATTLFAVALGFVLGFDLASVVRMPIAIPVSVLLVSAFVWMFDPYFSHHSNPTRKTALIHHSKWFSLLTWSFLIMYGPLSRYHDGLGELGFCGSVGAGLSCVTLFVLYWFVGGTKQGNGLVDGQADGA